MASSASTADVNDAVQPKPSPSRATTREDKQQESIQKKAYVPKELPEDFLRIILNQQQLNENMDNQLAHRLQYGMSPVNNQVNRSRILAQTYGRGRLQIDIVEAKLAKNYGLITRMDPYVRLRLGTKVFETPTDYNGGKNPRWRKTVMAFVPPGVDMLQIEIYDEKSFTNDEMVAYANFQLPESIFEGIFLDEWIPLSGKLGEDKEGYINIQFFFTPSEQLFNSANPYSMHANQHHQSRVNPANSAHSSSNSSSSSSKSASISPSNSILQQPRQVNLPPEVMPDVDTNRRGVENTLAVQHQHQQQQQPQQPTYNESDLASIKEMFPNTENVVIITLLEANSGNKEATIEALLAMMAVENN